MNGKNNWKNRAENLLIVLVTGAIALAVGYFWGQSSTIKTQKSTLNTEAIQKKINQPTTSNNTTNNVDLKAKKSENVVLDFEPKTDQRAVTNINQKDSCYTVNELREMSMKDIRRLRRD